MTFIPHYHYEIDPALFVWLAVVGMVLVGWVIWTIVDWRRK
jgi:hypothetical protein